MELETCQQILGLPMNLDRHEVILYLSSSKARLWLVFTLFSLFLLAVHCVHFKILEGKLAWSLELCI